MKNIKLVVSYDGSSFNGWQSQGNTKNTIQEVFEVTLNKVLGETVEIIGSGRTDTGVHALGQVLNFKMYNNDDMDIELLKEVLNKQLPNSICIREISAENERFHSRYNVKRKIYKYRILTSKNSDPFKRKYTYHFTAKLDVKKMKEASEFLLGEHDFSAFTTAKKTKKSNVRTIYKIEINQGNEEIELKFTGSGFLYNMVRILTGTLIEVGIGKINANDIVSILESKDRTNAGVTVPPQGLYLVEAIY